VVNGQINLPAVPGMLEDYVDMCSTIFASVGCVFSDEQLEHLRTVLKDQLGQAFEASPRSNIIISYSSPVGTMLNYNVNIEWWTIQGAYDNWVATREPPLFGKDPDARVWALSQELPNPKTARVLDIGAGTGRNSLALARRGHPVDAVEMTQKFADAIRLDANWETLDVRVIERDVFTTMSDLRRDYQLILSSEVVTDFRTTEQLRGICELAAECLAPGGKLVFNMFLAHDGYTPTAAARELGQQCYTSIFTRDELAKAQQGLPLDLIADDSVYEYEKTHLPEESWPPTSWYVGWVSGQDVFDVPRESSPIELRWLVFQKPR
jgi:2-polyprenyl-3-methyl-5-hydroxy-6-metoxy-1,4-benzoquinol methylase